MDPLAPALLTGGTGQADLTDGQSKPLWHLKRMKLFFFFNPKREIRFYPFSKNFIQRALSVYKKYLIH